MVMKNKVKGGLTYITLMEVPHQNLLKLRSISFNRMVILDNKVSTAVQKEFKELAKKLEIDCNPDSRRFFDC